jgi:hypothetical protein
MLTNVVLSDAATTLPRPRLVENAAAPNPDRPVAPARCPRTMAYLSACTARVPVCAFQHSRESTGKENEFSGMQLR